MKKEQGEKLSEFKRGTNNKTLSDDDATHLSLRSANIYRAILFRLFRGSPCPYNIPTTSFIADRKGWVYWSRVMVV